MSKRKITYSLLLSSLLMTSVLNFNTYAAKEEEGFNYKDQEGKEIQTDHKVEIPKFEDKHLKAGDAFYNSGQYKLAYDEYYISIRLNPTFWQGYRGIGNVFLKQGKIDKSINNYLKAISIIEPTYVSKTLEEGQVALKEGDYFLAIAKFQKILDIDPDAGRLVNEGIDLLKEDKKSAAQKKFEEAIKLDDNYADAHYKLGNMYYEKKKYPEAIKEFESAVKSDPNEYAYQYSLGNAYYKLSMKNSKKPDLDMLNKAVKKYSISKRLNPRDYEVMFNLATAKVDLLGINIGEKSPNEGENKSEINESVDLLERYTSYNPKDINAHIYLGDAYTLVGGKPRSFVRAAEEYKKAISIDNARSDLYFKLGMTYYLANMIEPKSEDLPITNENSKLYIKFGKKFYHGDMLTYAQENFNSYLLYNLRGNLRKDAQTYLDVIEDQLNKLGFRVPDRTTGR